jgi:hypothetical protein
LEEWKSGRMEDWPAGAFWGGRVDAVGFENYNLSSL